MPPSWSLPAERTTADSTIVADLNKLRDIIQLLGGNGTSQPTSDIEALKAQVDLINSLPVGSSIMSDALTTPTGYLIRDGSAISRTTYSVLYDVITASKGAVTISNATPGVGTLNGHGLISGDCIELTTDGGLPTGLSVNTNYYIEWKDANSFYFHAARSTAKAGTSGSRIATSSAGSGTHTLRHCPHGISTAANFLLPNSQGVGHKGVGSQTINTRSKTGPVFGEAEEDQGQGHLHGITQYQATGGGQSSAAAVAANAVTTNTLVPSTDGTNGTPRTGTTTRDNTLGSKFYIKYE